MTVKASGHSPINRPGDAPTRGGMVILDEYFFPDKNSGEVELIGESFTNKHPQLANYLFFPDGAPMVVMELDSNEIVYRAKVPANGHININGIRRVVSSAEVNFNGVVKTLTTDIPNSTTEDVSETSSVYLMDENGDFSVDEDGMFIVDGEHTATKNVTYFENVTWFGGAETYTY